MNCMTPYYCRFGQRTRVHALVRARRTLGDSVVDFYVHTARLEVQAFESGVTDWERRRYFEQI
jgi:glutamine synthetase